MLSMAGPIISMAYPCYRNEEKAIASDSVFIEGSHSVRCLTTSEQPAVAPTPSSSPYIGVGGVSTVAEVLVRAELVEIDGFLVFTGRDSARGEEPWVSDGLSAWMVVDLVAGPQGSQPTDFTRFGEDLIFSAIGDDRQRSLWRVLIQDFFDG